MQEVILFGSETWVMNPHMGRALGSFYNSVARGITGMQPKQQEHRSWYYTPLETVIEEAVFEEIGAYVLNRKNTVAQYIATQPILNLWEKTLRRTGAWVVMIWWHQEGLDLAGAREVAAAASEAAVASEATLVEDM